MSEVALTPANKKATRTLSWTMGVYIAAPYKDIYSEIIESYGLKYTCDFKPDEKTESGRVVNYEVTFVISYDPSDPKQVEKVNNAEKEILTFSRRSRRIMDATKGAGVGCLMPCLFVLAMALIWVL